MLTSVFKRTIFCIGLLWLAGSSVAQIPLLSENFNECDLPSDWTVNLIGTGPASWLVGEPQNSNSDGSTIDGTCMLIIDDDAAGNNTPPYAIQFISPVFDGTVYSTLKLQLDVHFREIYGTSLKVFVDQDGQLQEVISLSDGQGTGEQFSEFIHLEADISFFASEQMSIVIQYDDNESWGWWAGVDTVSYTHLTLPTILLV